MEYINTQIVDWLPESVKGVLVDNGDCGCTILINGKLSKEEQVEAYKHELNHIKEDDLRSGIKASELEGVRHYE